MCSVEERDAVFVDEDELVGGASLRYRSRYATSAHDAGMDRPAPRVCRLVHVERSGAVLEIEVPPPNGCELLSSKALTGEHAKEQSPDEREEHTGQQRLPRPLGASSGVSGGSAMASSVEESFAFRLRDECARREREAGRKHVRGLGRKPFQLLNEMKHGLIPYFQVVVVPAPAPSEPIGRRPLDPASGERRSLAAEPIPSAV